MSKKINDAVDLVVNSIVSRRQEFLSSVTGSANTKQSKCWSDYGYPINPTFDNFFAMYQRNGYAKAGIELIPDKCWQSNPKVVVENNENWGKLFADFARRVNLWHNLHMLDLYQRVGRYAGLVVHVKDDAELKDELVGPVNLDDIDSVVPFYEGQLKHSGEWYEDTENSKYGLPKSYDLDEREVGAQQGVSNKRRIHESRVIIWAEGATGNSIFGTPVLQAGINALINIEKINGAGGEGFWKNVRTPLALSTESGVDVAQLAEAYGVEVSELSDKINDKLKAYNTNLDSAFLLGGMKATPMTVSLPNPAEFLAGNKLEFAASVKIPLTILEGNQSGNQASQENGSTFDEQCESRRANEIDGFIIGSVIKWLEGVEALVPQDSYEVQWDSLVEPSPSEKLEAAFKMAQMNQMALGTGMAYFTPEQIAERAGYKMDEDDGR